jgi:hypothetical protein
MRNTITPFLFALFVSLLVATTTVGQGRFSIAPTLAPTYHYSNWASQFENKDASIGSESTTGISAGLTASYAFTPKWSLSAGFLYNRSSGNSRFDNFMNISTQARQTESLQLPLLLNYTSSTRRLSPYFSVGLLANYTYRTTNPNTMVSTYHRIDEGTVSTFSLYGMAGMGVSYRVTPKLTLIVQPTAAYRLNGPSKGYPISYTRWNEYLYGLQTQLKYTF